MEIESMKFSDSICQKAQSNCVRPNIVKLTFASLVTMRKKARRGGGQGLEGFRRYMLRVLKITISYQHAIDRKN